MTAEPFGAPSPTAFQALTPDDPREVGGYRLRARLGAGGMGRVYLAHTPGGRPVALKVVRPELAEDPEFRHRFAQEVASARRIHGLYTAQVVDAGTDAATPWLATTFVPGPSLQQVVHRHGPLPERTALLLLAGIAEALQAIHAAGVVHRDLKPGNVLIAADGPRVIDFGIARAADASPLTGTGLRIGSPGYMAPEQVVGGGATPATDVFALGALIAYVGSGTPPFGDGPEPASLYRAVHEEPDVSGLPAGLHELVRRCLAKNPGDRPDTARLIEAARNHPATGGELRFSDDWLPRQVSTEIHRHTDLPAGTPPPATALDRARAAADAPTALVPAAPATRLAPVTDTGPATGGGPGGEPGTGRRRAAATARRGARTAVLTTAALLVGAAGAFLLLDPGYLDDLDDQNVAATGSPGPSTAATAAPAPAAPSTATTPPPATTLPGFTAVYSNLELTSPDHSYEFDLRTGKVAAQDTSAWYLGRHNGEFYIPEDSDAYLAPGADLTLPDCVKGVETQPASTLPFGTVGTDRSFCVRAKGGREFAVVRALTTGPDDGPVRVTVTYYRRTA
ncbi:serine/threonine protein kinase [Kitasatospora sp. NBC_01560]|uniref:serine/threonine-protein kinase n=1 Tax=Kitasatospora sp. NBC_01560 TaxID=2975965 RepID=UPI00386E901D